MRRNDREVTDVNDILKIIEKCESVNLGLCENNIPYVVPLSFGYEYADGKLTLYLHGAKEGRKLDIIAGNKNACFSMDCSYKLLAGESVSSYSAEYESVMGSGRIEILDDLNEKRGGLSVLMRHYAPGRSFEFPEKVMDKTAVLKFTVDEFTAKRNME